MNWLDKKIYWTSGEHISFISQDSGQPSTLLTGLVNPRGIVILTADKYEWFFRTCLAAIFSISLPYDSQTKNP